MPEPTLPPAVERFLVAHVPSVAHLEALLLLRGDPQRWWRTNELAESLYVDVQLAAAIVRHLSGRGLAVTNGANDVRFATDAETPETIELVADTYRKRLVAVSKFLHARQESVALRSFADAFRFRKD